MADRRFPFGSVLGGFSVRVKNDPRHPPREIPAAKAHGEAKMVTLVSMWLCLGGMASAAALLAAISLFEEANPLGAYVCTGLFSMLLFGLIRVTIRHFRARRIVEEWEAADRRRRHPGRGGEDDVE